MKNLYRISLPTFAACMAMLALPVGAQPQDRAAISPTRCQIEISQYDKKINLTQLKGTKSGLSGKLEPDAFEINLAGVDCKGAATWLNDMTEFQRVAQHAYIAMPVGTFTAGTPREASLIGGLLSLKLTDPIDERSKSAVQDWCGPLQQCPLVATVFASRWPFFDEQTQWIPKATVRSLSLNGKEYPFSQLKRQGNYRPLQLLVMNQIATGAHSHLWGDRWSENILLQQAFPVLLEFSVKP